MSRDRESVDNMIVELYNQGLSDEEMAEIIGIKKESITMYRCKLGLQVGRPITKRWLTESGVGAQWDYICRVIRGK